MKTKRTKKAYIDLFNDPATLFKGNVQTVLFPNGQHEIWIKNNFNGFRITASEGPAGMSLTVSRFVGNGPLTLLAADENYKPINVDTVSETTLCFYNQDEASQAFKDWYIADSENLATKEKLRVRFEALKVLK